MHHRQQKKRQMPPCALTASKELVCCLSSPRGTDGSVPALNAVEVGLMVNGWRLILSGKAGKNQLMQQNEDGVDCRL